MKSWRHPVFAALSILLFVGLLAGYELLQEVRTTAVHSCVASIGRQIQNNPGGLLSELDPQWRTLSKEKTKELVLTLQNQRSLDCGRVLEEANGVYTDLWGNPIRISVRRKDGDLEVLVWTAGPDGQPRTRDDTTTVWREPVPPNVPIE